MKIKAINVKDNNKLLGTINYKPKEGVLMVLIVH